MNERAPFLVRISGLPITAMSPFATGICANELAALLAAEAELAAARTDLVDRLFAGLQSAPPELRRLLLSVKRDAFNGRGLASHEGKEGWDELSALSEGLLPRVVSLEGRLAGLGEELAAAFRRERSAQSRYLASLYEHPSLLRGLALASPSLVSQAGRLRNKNPEDFGRKERGLEQSLLRYISRAACKLSPYSSLTRMGLGEAVPGAEGRPRLIGGPWRERSLLRLKRFVLDQVVDVLFLCPAVRESLRVTLNNTLEEIEPGRFRYLQPGYWFLHQESGELRYFQDALVKTGLSGPVVDWLRAELADGSRVYGDLAAGLDRAFPGAEGIRQLEKMLRIKFLTLLPPWPSSADHLEVEVRDYLRALGGDSLAALTGLLDRLVELEHGFADTREPWRTLEEIDLLLDEIWTEAAALAGLGPEARREKMRKGNYYEDVFLESAPGASADGEVLTIPRAAAEEAARSVQPLIRLTALFSQRNDFLYTLRGLLEQRWPGRREIGFLEVFSAAQPLWQEYRQFLAGPARQGRGWQATFDPMGLPVLAGLAGLRSALWPRVEPCIDRRDDGTFIDADALAAVTRDVPEIYEPNLGGCLFLQPADAEGRLWVLNRLYEGTGRYGSRFTPVMSDGMRRRYTDHFRARSVVLREGEEAELLDLFRIQGDTLNVHWAQTPRVLETPGETPSVPPSRTLSLRDLRVLLPEGDGLPRIVDGEGRHCLPVHLGGAGHAFMPTVIKFLSLFGPGDLKAVFPARNGKEIGSMTIWERMVLGNVVLARKKWAVPPSEVESHIPAGASDEEVFVVMNRWRLAAGIPDQAFITEKIQHKVLGTMFKPQYIDFTSPLFVPVFRSTLAEKPLRLAVEEMLPSAGMLPSAEDGTSWAIELQLDTLALQPARAGLAALSPHTVPVPERALESSFALGGGTT